MTPTLANAYEPCLAAAGAAPLADLVAPLRAAFVARVGAFVPTDPWFEERAAALWDRVLTDRGVLARLRAADGGLGGTHDDALVALTRAQRGLFDVHAGGAHVDLVCRLTGAAFRLSAADAAGRALGSGRGVVDDVAPGTIDARVVPTREGVAILPGMLVHPAEATALLPPIVARARELGLPDDTLLDALLAMRHRHASLSRMKVKQIYRAELLETLIERGP